MNYVLFYPDEMRAETLHCYGHPTIKTPNYDKLAENGVLFEQCHVQNTVCSPSRISMITGRYVHNDGHRTLFNLIKPYEKNMFGYLKDAGYDVAFYGKNDMFSPESKKLFTDIFTNKKGTNHSNSTHIHRVDEKGYYDFIFNPVEGNVTEHLDYKNVDAGIEFINSHKKGGKPFILFLPLQLPHPPYTVQEPYYSMYKAEDVVPLRPYGTAKPMFHDGIRKVSNIDGEDLSDAQRIYMGMISFTDMLLGRIMDAIDNSEVADDTMLIATSDHGDYAGDYGLVEKWPNGMEDVLTRVPLVIKAPFCKKGHRVKEQVELFDIMPTILQSSNIETKHTHFAHSLIPQLKGASGDPDRAVFCEGGYNENEPHCLETINFPKHDSKEANYYAKKLHEGLHPKNVGRGTMIRTLTHKLILRTYGDSELYDLVNDPREINNLYNDIKYKDIKQELERKILDWYIATSDTVPFETDPRA